VLVVDDDEDIRSSLADYFRLLGCSVFEAPDGKSALERVRTHPLPLIVVLDWLMPDMDGVQVLQALAAGGAVLPYTFILGTASAGHADAMERLTQDLATIPANLAVTVVGKPFDLEELTALVARAAEQLAAVTTSIPDA
jgi:CheY-like chemotaxis protein